MSSTKYKAFLFDLNGTMIDDMDYHITTWHKILNDIGATITLAETKQQCYGKNNELLERVFPNRFNDEEKNKLSVEKEKVYQKIFLPHLKLINGLDIFLAKAKANGIKMAIGSAAIMFNIDFVLDNLNIRHYFDAIVSADDVTISKPHEETYLKCASLLNINPANCLVFEDVPKGAECALNANMDCTIFTTTHQAHEFSGFPNIISTQADYSSLLHLIK
jgi:beta-phosphoglucomutase